MNDTCGMVCADNGIIQTTMDGGASWQPIHTGYSQNLYCICETDLNTLLAVGQGGLIIKSIDGGATWSQKTSGVTTDLSSMDMYDMNNMLTCGDNGVVLATTDAGETWNILTSGTTEVLNQVIVTDLQNCYVVGTNSTILRSTDLGQTWLNETHKSHSRMSSVNYNSVAFYPGSSSGIIVGDNGTIMLSSDGGATWNASDANGVAVSFYHVRFSDANEADIVGQAQTILKTTDAGYTWTNVYLGAAVASNLYCLNFPTQLNGVAVGTDNTMLYTFDGGYTWTSTYGTHRNMRSSKTVASTSKLNQNYPNPFNPTTVISYVVGFDANVSVKVYDIVGREVATLVNSFQKSGSYSVSFNALNLSSGVYFYKFTAVNNNNRIDKTMRMILTK